MKALKTAVKIVGVVAGVAAIATGFGAPLGAGLLGASWGAIATGAALAGAVLDTLSPARPKAGSAIGSQTEWRADPQAGIPYAMGRTAYAGNIVHRDTWAADGKYFGNVMVWSGGGPVNAFEAFQIDRETVTFSSNAATGALAGFAWLKTQLGACPESNALSPVNGTMPGWDSDNKLSGYCAGLFETMFDKEGKQWAGGFPQSLLAILQGVKVYDPRLDSTYPGGSGSCRVDDEDTWVYSERPALHALTWALGRHQNGARVMAVGLPPSSIDMPRYVDWANVCDANGWKVGGVVSSLDDKWDVLKKICQAGAAKPVRLGGILSVDFQAPRVSLATITAKNLAGPGKIVGTKGRRARINTGVPRLRLESHGWEVTTLDPVGVDEYVTQDGGLRSREIDLELVQDKDQAAELVAYEVADGREFGPIMLPLKIEFVGYKPGDALTLNIPELGLAEQLAVIARRNINQQTGVITHDLVSETDEKHDWALGRTGTPPPTPSLTPIDLSDVPAPGADAWAASALLLLGGSSGALPAIRVTGTVDNANAEAVIIELREDGETDWTGMEMHAPGMTSRDLVNVKPATEYEVAISYIVRGVRGARRVEGPVKTTSLLAEGSFIQPDPPSAAESMPGTIWLDSDNGYFAARRVEGDGLLRDENDDLVLDDQDRPIEAAWVAHSDQSIRDSAAQLAGMADDGELNVVEKKILVERAAALEEGWAILDARAAALGVTTARTAAANARSAWLAMLGAISPPWNTTNVPSPVNRAAYDAALVAYQEALDDLSVAIGTIDGTTGLQINGPARIEIAADHTGAVLAGQLPASAHYTARVGIGTVTGAAWSRTVISGGATCSIDASTGALTVTAIAGATSRVAIDCAYLGVQQRLLIDVVRVNAPPPASGGGGSGGTTSSKSTFAAITGGWATVATLDPVTVGSGGEVALSAPLTVTIFASAPDGGRDIEVRWRRETAPSTWETVDDTTVASAPPAYSINEGSDFEPAYVAYPGAVSSGTTVTGLTPSSQQTFHLQARQTGGFADTRYLTGTATATGQ